MKVEDILTAARESMTAQRVFAPPVERDGITVVPAAAVSGGGGAGTGTKEDGQEGGGGGFGMGAKPVGAYVIENGQVHWRPAVDVNRLMLVVAAVALTVALRTVRCRGSQSS